MNAEEPLNAERTVAQVAQTQSRSIRLQRRLALILVGVVGLGVLTWYYLHLADTARATPAAQKSAQASVASEMKLPPLHWADPPVVHPAAASQADRTAEEPSPAPSVGDLPAAAALVAPPGPATARVRSSIGPMNAASPVLLRGSAADSASAPITSPSSSLASLNSLLAGESIASPARPTPVPPALSPLGAALVPTVTTPVEAAIVPSRRWLLPKGSFLDCTLETAIDSTLPGMTTCVLAVDVFGADGRVVLLERGTKLVGETRADIRPGQARVSVLWSEARTPTGVVVALASPGTDDLGRAGVPGRVDNHFAARFGAAVLLSVIDGAVSAMVAREQGSAGVVYNAQGSRDVATDALRVTIGIPPTITVAPGARVQVLVARDIDFRSVYRLVSRAGG
jgi:type IV secretion system protein VirB10